MRSFALAALAAVLGLAPAAAQGEDAADKPPAAVAAMDLGGQKVLILPVQHVSGVGATRDQVTAEVVFALGEWDARTSWVTPTQLRSALRRTPGYAPDPAALPQDAYLHHGERYVRGALASQLRRYTALMDTRLALVLREAAFLPAAEGGGRVRLSAAMIDSRNGGVVWYGEADGEVRPTPDAAALATAAASLAARMVIPGGQ